jgi:murein DD-endopeptidase MepM/ murein hydrolase activator NlpD
LTISKEKSILQVLILKARLIFLLIIFSVAALQGNNTTYKSDSLNCFRVITKKSLARLIDSVFELKSIGSQDIELINYYAEALKSSKGEPVTVFNFNLNELNQYSLKDERSLFPNVNLESVPNLLNLILENKFLSYYTSPWPGVVTSNFGWREGKLHKGIDIDLRKGDKVTAAFTGIVRVARRQGGFGNVVVLRHPNGLETVYAHLSRIKVKPGDVVKSGQLIGLGGSTGHSTGTHLHFEVRYQGHPLNPGAIISFTENKLIHHTITIKNSKFGLSAFPGNCYLHKVNKGESWRMIAIKYGLSLQQLMTMNGIGRRYVLKPGQELRVN